MPTSKSLRWHVMSWLQSVHRLERKFFNYQLVSLLLNFFQEITLAKMLSSNTVLRSNGEVLTGKEWRKEHDFFDDLPFYSDIPRMEEMGRPLQGSLSLDKWYGKLLVVSNLPFSYPSNLIAWDRNSQQV